MIERVRKTNTDLSTLNRHKAARVSLFDFRTIGPEARADELLLKKRLRDFHFCLRNETRGGRHGVGSTVGAMVLKDRDCWHAACSIRRRVAFFCNEFR